MKLLYFAWLRQKIGKAEETLDVPAEVTQVGQLLDWLESLGPNYATALDAWRAKAQATVDNAQMRYFVVHIHRLIEPEATA